MTTRRGFLKGILAFGMAPAVVKAENIMRIWTPPQDLWFAPAGFNRGKILKPGWTIEHQPDLLVGYRGKSTIDVGFFYAPYVPTLRPQ